MVEDQPFHMVFIGIIVGDLLWLLAGLLTTSLTLASKGEHFAPHRTAFSLHRANH